MTAADPYFSATADSSSWKSAPVSLDKILDQVVWEGRAGFVSRISGAADAEYAGALGRKGGLKGGRARADALTPDERKKIAQKAARRRWSKE